MLISTAKKQLNSFFLNRIIMSGVRSEWELFTLENSFLPSTLFFVDFMRVSSLDFRGIFQTILKTAVFSVTSTFLSIFIKGQNIRGTYFYKFWFFLPVLAASFQTYGFISATQYDRRSTLLTPYSFYSGDLLSLPRCVQQTIITSNVRWSSERFRRFGTLFRSHRANAGHGTGRVFLIQPSGRQHAWHKTRNHVNALRRCCLQESNRR